MAQRNPLEGIFSAKDLRNPYLAAGIAGRLAANVEVDSYTARALDRVVARVALSALDIQPPETTTEPEPTPLWHGTGRFKYQDGEVVDVLKSIADTGLILPHYDKFDLDRPMTSVSLARSRMYARAYADMHGRGHDEPERYGSSLFWACAFLGSVAVEASKEVKVWRPSGYYTMLGHLAVANAAEWYKSVTRVPNPGVVEVYKRGSDIQHNYPILFGVGDVDPAPTSKAVAIHEVRTEDPIWVETEVTHVEVPRSKVEETKRVLDGVDIIPMEEGEWYSARHTFTEHMHGKI